MLLKEENVDCEIIKELAIHVASAIIEYVNTNNIDQATTSRYYNGQNMGGYQIRVTQILEERDLFINFYVEEPFNISITIVEWSISIKPTKYFEVSLHHPNSIKRFYNTLKGLMPIFFFPEEEEIILVPLDVKEEL